MTAYFFFSGGVFHYAMVAQNGAEMFGRMAYREITPPERLVWVNFFAEGEGTWPSRPNSRTTNSPWKS